MCKAELSYSDAGECMSNCVNKSASGDAIKDAILRRWLFHPDVQHHLNSNRRKLMLKGVSVNIREEDSSKK